MNRSIQILSVFSLLMLVSGVGAQTPLTCGIADINGPSQVNQGTPLVFKAKITGMTHTTKPEFKWKISAGTITSGQGTEEITIDTTGLAGQEVIATLELSGISLACKELASKTVQVDMPGITCGLAFDQYGDLKFEDEKARLDNFAIQLINQPLSSGHILMSAGQTTFENETSERLERIKSYLVDVREIDPNRIVSADCGFLQNLSVRLYIVPLGSTFPACEDSIEIPLSKVRFTKLRPKSSKKQR